MNKQTRTRQAITKRRREPNNRTEGGQSINQASEDRYKRLNRLRNDIRGQTTKDRTRRRQEQSEAEPVQTQTPDDENNPQVWTGPGMEDNVYARNAT
ncbi:hypothetical protein BDV19DRAFT_52449 [Aspergillus venezuelensis]